MTMIEDRPALTTPVAAATDIARLASAYQSLQRHNVRVASMVAEQLQVGPTDLRAIMFAAWNDDLTPKHLAEYLEMTTGATTSLIDRVVAAGMMLREPHPTDRRSQLLSLTQAGRDAVQLVLETYHAAFADALAPEQVGVAATIVESIAVALSVVEIPQA